MDRPLESARERIFNVPPVLAGLVGSLCFIHLMVAFVLPANENEALLELFAFDPVRYRSTLFPVPGETLPGGFAAGIWTFVTYAFFHVNLTHLIFNLIWLVTFGTPVARRFGTWRFLGFFAFAAAAGALAHLITHIDQNVPTIGASAAVFGLMAGAMRFIFQPGGPLGRLRLGEEDTYRVPAKPLGAMFRDRRMLLFVLVWFGLNALLAMPLFAMPGIQAGVAWEAHVGGFVAGLLGFAAFDPLSPLPEGSPREDNEATDDEPPIPQ